MRIAIITESFPPDVNGVANCVVRVAENLIRKGHVLLVIAPESAYSTADTDGDFPCPVKRVPSVPVPGYTSFRLGLPSLRLRRAVADHGADVIHLASPVALGAWGSYVARALDLPVVAVYQTDLPNYARAYRLGQAGESFAWRWLRDLHNAAERTLAPSTMTAADLEAHGMERVHLWGRGVDTERFCPDKRDEKLRAELAPNGEVLVGYVGRLAIEKRVDLLASLAGLSGIRVVITGTGPAEDELRQSLPDAVFTGPRSGDDLARVYASLDVFTHTGPFETFGQTIQEAAASGLPVIAPASGGPLDLVDEGVTGHLVAPEDGVALAAAVAALAGDGSRRTAMGQAARQKVLGRTWSALTDELVGHYEAAIDSAERAASAAMAALWNSMGRVRRQAGGLRPHSEEHGKGLRIVRLANFVGPQSGGLRTALRELGVGYREAGHDPDLIIPGEHFSDEETPQGRVITVAAPPAPGLGGDYRAIFGRRSVREYDEIVATTKWAAAEFEAINAANVTLVTLGVDLELFNPEQRSEQVRAAYARPGRGRGPRGRLRRRHHHHARQAGGAASRGRPAAGGGVRLDGGNA